MFVCEIWSNAKDEKVIVRADKQDNGLFGDVPTIDMPHFDDTKASAFVRAINNYGKRNKTHHGFLRQKGFEIELVITDCAETAEIATKAGLPAAFCTNDLSIGKALIENVKDVANCEVLVRKPETTH